MISGGLFLKLVVAAWLRLEGIARACWDLLVGEVV